MLRCLDGALTNPYVQVTITLSSSMAATNFCLVVFYFARDCKESMYHPRMYNYIECLFKLRLLNTEYRL